MLRLHQFGFVAGSIVFLLAGTALAGPVSPTINVYTSMAPDPYGSPSFDLYTQNVLYALRNGLSTYGAPGTPSYYSQSASFAMTDPVGTSFPSWRGDAPPPVGFENETGNALSYGLVLLGNSYRFTLNGITFTDDFYGDIFVRSLGSAVATGTLMGDFIALGVGPDGLPGTPDDRVFNAATPGAATAQLFALYFSGFTTQFFVDDPAQLEYYALQYQYADLPQGIGTYNLVYNTATGPALASQTAEVDFVTPEPGTLALAGMGLLLGFALRKKR